MACEHTSAASSSAGVGAAGLGGGRCHATAHARPLLLGRRLLLGARVVVDRQLVERRHEAVVDRQRTLQVLLGALEIVVAVVVLDGVLPPHLQHRQLHQRLDVLVLGVAHRALHLADRALDVLLAASLKL